VIFTHYFQRGYLAGEHIGRQYRGIATRSPLASEREFLKIPRFAHARQFFSVQPTAEGACPELLLYVWLLFSLPFLNPSYTRSLSFVNPTPSAITVISYF